MSPLRLRLRLLPRCLLPELQYPPHSGCGRLEPRGAGGRECGLWPEWGLPAGRCRLGGEVGPARSVRQMFCLGQCRAVDTTFRECIHFSPRLSPFRAGRHHHHHHHHHPHGHLPLLLIRSSVSRPASALDYIHLASCELLMGRSGIFDSCYLKHQTCWNNRENVREFIRIILHRLFVQM
ncbi:hypothetical protein MPTK1_6g06020 [Marchantia polymorpha subsp. ruderalis]|uniref:Uncharacterized protein n=2 Tax=Marchantia polymorpha TaxID=3197 RepID=A0AAF6BP18_MARPO|nr:hypothetical protein MARPO_0097s0042 [Marchantia polymorpha]BBN13752.1 hypothetical protein Mp_6g06020 [Marchantia polymorpha subsp. ruderalis]|eukprot:PTQ32560.1 hypothetical protein MARPO_0097s0042 [Marchantia polymorpha]